MRCVLIGPPGTGKSTVGAMLAASLAGRFAPSLRIPLRSVIAAAIAFPVGVWIGHTGRGRRVVVALVPPITLIVAVLGSIIAGVATPTESASVGSVGAIFLCVVKLLADHFLGRGGEAEKERRLLWFWLGFLAVLVAANRDDTAVLIVLTVRQLNEIDKIWTEKSEVTLGESEASTDDSSATEE